MLNGRKFDGGTLGFLRGGRSCPPEGWWRVEGFCAAFGIGLPMTRHPGTGAAGLPDVGVRRLVENKADRGIIRAKALP
jgi:hypothetical protein